MTLKDLLEITSTSISVGEAFGFVGSEEDRVWKEWIKITSDAKELLSDKILTTKINKIFCKNNEIRVILESIKGK